MIGIALDDVRTSTAQSLTGQRVTVTGRIRFVDYVEQKGVRTLGATRMTRTV